MHTLVRLVVHSTHRRGATANRPLRSVGVLYLGQRPPLPPQAVPRVAGVCPPCCPTPSLLSHALPATLPPCRLSWLPPHAHPASRSPVLVAALVRRPPCLPAGPSPSSFVAPSHKIAACGHFLLHERLELLVTCAPGGTQEVRQRRNSLDCKCTALAEGRFQQVSGQWNFSKRPVEGRFQQVASGRSFCTPFTKPGNMSKRGRTAQIVVVEI